MSPVAQAAFGAAWAALQNGGSQRQVSAFVAAAARGAVQGASAVPGPAGGVDVISEVQAVLDVVSARCGDGKTKLNVGEAKGVLKGLGQGGPDLAKRLGKASTVRNAQAHPDLGQLERHVAEFLDRQGSVADVGGKGKRKVRFIGDTVRPRCGDAVTDEADEHGSWGGSEGSTGSQDEQGVPQSGSEGTEDDPEGFNAGEFVAGVSAGAQADSVAEGVKVGEFGEDDSAEVLPGALEAVAEAEAGSAAVDEAFRLDQAEVLETLQGADGKGHGLDGAVFDAEGVGFGGDEVAEADPAADAEAEAVAEAVPAAADLGGIVRAFLLGQDLAAATASEHSIEGLVHSVYQHLVDSHGLDVRDGPHVQAQVDDHIVRSVKQLRVRRATTEAAAVAQAGTLQGADGNRHGLDGAVCDAEGVGFGRDDWPSDTEFDEYQQKLYGLMCGFAQLLGGGGHP